MAAELKFLGYCPFYKTGGVEVLRFPVYSSTSFSANSTISECSFDTTEPLETNGQFTQDAIDYLNEKRAEDITTASIDDTLWDKSADYSIFACGNHMQGYFQFGVLYNGLYVTSFGINSFVTIFDGEMACFFIAEYNGAYFPCFAHPTFTKVYCKGDPNGDYGLVTSLDIQSSPAAEPEQPAWTFSLRDFLSGIASAAASRGVLPREPIAYQNMSEEVG